MIDSDYILRYGDILTDDKFIASETWQGLRFSLRIRIIEWEGIVYYHKMIDGEIVEIKEIASWK